MAKLTTVTLVEIPYQDMLKVREVNQNSLIWFDDPEKESFKEEKKHESEESESEDDLDAEDDDEKSPHENNRDYVSKVVEKEFKSLVPFKFIVKKDEAL